MNFENTIVWKEKYPGKLIAQNGQVLDYSAPEELQGMRGPLTPEDAFVGSANMCFQIIFEGVAADLGLKLLEYKCKAVGDLETVEGIRKFVKITIYPEIKLEPGSKLSNFDRALSITKRKCIITNSMDLEFEVLPKVL